MSSEDDGLVSSLSLNPEPPGDEDTVDDVETEFSVEYEEAGSVCVRLDYLVLEFIFCLYIHCCLYFYIGRVVVYKM